MKSKLLFAVIIFLLTFSDCILIYPQAAFNTGEMGVVVNSFGRIRFYIPDTTADRSIDRLTMLFGVDENQVFDYINDQDVEEPTVLVSPPSFGDYEIYGSYNNAYSGLPPDVLVKTHVYGWDSEAFSVVKFVIINRETETLNGIPGLDIIPQINTTYENDTIWFNTSNNVLYMVDSFYIGMKIVLDQIQSARILEWYSGYSVDSAYYSWLTYNNFDTTPLYTDEDGAVVVMAGSSVNLSPGDSVELFVAVAYGADETEMLANLQEAETKVGGTGIQPDVESPSGYYLQQNFPNPFNPDTKIKFSIPRNSFVNLIVYNILGEAVEELISTELSAGAYTYSFNGSALPSGTYFYEITAGEFKETKKMLLMK